MTDDAPTGVYAVKVDGVEMDHADTRSEAKRLRNALIYGGLGTEASVTIEKRA